MNQHFCNGNVQGPTYTIEVQGCDCYGNTEPDRYIPWERKARACAIRTNLPAVQGCAEPPFDVWAMLLSAGA